MYKFLFFFLFCFCLKAQSIGDVVKNGNAFLESLSEEQLETALFTFEDTLRTNWTNLPVGMVPRTGVRFGKLSETSKIAFHRVLTSVLSSQGYLKVTGIMSLDDILNMMYKARLDKGEINQGAYDRMMNLDWERDNFFISFWGKPDAVEPWTFKLGGHHLGIHLTSTGGKLSMTPLFMGTDPSEVLITEYAGLRVLSKEEDYGFLFINALDEAQKAKAILSRDTPRDIITAPGRDPMIHDYYGIKVSDLNVEQKNILRHVIKEYLNNLEFGLAQDAFDKMEAAGFDNIYFAWIGSLEPRVNHYYVINGPTFLIEYDNAGFQNDGNHIHSIYREKGNDFGEDILKTHYLQHQH